MVWWVLALAILAILSYLADVGVFSWQNLRVPVLNASLLSLLILLAATGLLYRTLWMKRKGRREMLEKKIQELESKLSALAPDKK